MLHFPAATPEGVVNKTVREYLASHPEAAPGKQPTTRVVQIPASAQAWEKATYSESPGNQPPLEAATEVILFQSPTTGKVRLLPREQWEEALKAGYKPTEYTVMWSSEGQRGMVPNEQVKEKIKAGYRTQEQIPKAPVGKLTPFQGTVAKGADFVSDSIRIEFPGTMSNEEVLHIIQAQFLRSRPTFSIWAAMRARRKPVLAGLTLFVLGALGCVWLSRQALRGTRRHSPSLP